MYKVAVNRSFKFTNIGTFIITMHAYFVATRNDCDDFVTQL